MFPREKIQKRGRGYGIKKVYRAYRKRWVCLCNYEISMGYFLKNVYAKCGPMRKTYSYFSNTSNT